MSNVGLKFIVPVTNIGRLFAVGSMFTGKFATSLALYGMNIISRLTLEENRAYTNLKTIEHYLERRNQEYRIAGITGYIRMIKNNYIPKRFQKYGKVKALMKLQIDQRVLCRKYKESIK